MRFRHRGGNVRQVGRRVVPKRIEAEVIGGSMRLDFTEAVITEPVLKVDAHVRGGRLLIITRRASSSTRTKLPPSAGAWPSALLQDLSRRPA
jgi:hypothetical protein